VRVQELDGAPDDRGHVVRAFPEVRCARYEFQLDGRPGPAERLGPPDALRGRHHVVRRPVQEQDRRRVGPGLVHREAARVTRPGGLVVASLFAAPERAQGTVVHEAMSALIPPEQAGDHAPYALSAPGNLEAALADAGLSVTGDGEVVCHWRYATMDDAVKALLCSAGGARAIQAAGRDAVHDVLQRALAQFQDPQTGVVTLVNTSRWVAARRVS
jgi:hypothetical protein